ncbi:MAG: hypothetical protein U9O95_04305 [Candidatus Marinimicrobia bacterium]|nr:hypothetical protein [Candidatus Neomarinimicrobiota bacterium]
MKFFKMLSLVFLGCLVLFFLVGILLPQSATLEKKYEIFARAAIIQDEIVDLYQNHLWPIWNAEDTSTVFTPLENGAGYTWEGPNVGHGECAYTLGVDFTVHDYISFNDREVAETIWRFDGANPVVLNVSITVFAGKNISTRWTNLFLNRLIGGEIDRLVIEIISKVEIPA